MNGRNPVYKYKRKLTAWNGLQVMTGVGSKTIRAQVRVTNTLSSEYPVSVRPTDAYLTTMFVVCGPVHILIVFVAIGITEGNSPNRPQSLNVERLAALSQRGRGRPINCQLVDSAVVYRPPPPSPHTNTMPTGKHDDLHGMTHCISELP